jgi:hypothetical protein
MVPPVQLTAPKPPGAALRTAKFDAVPNDGADRVAADGPMFEVARSEGAVMRDAESLLHAAESSANVRTPAASLGRASARTKCI